MKKRSNFTQVSIKEITPSGILLSVHEKEYFLPFNEFPWFKKATIDQIYNLQFFHGHHLHWPDLDIDIDLDNLKNPDAYPLKYS